MVFKCKSYRKVQLEHGCKIDKSWTINTLRLVSESDSTGFARLSVKEASIWKFVEVNKYMYPILHNQINLGNNVLYDLIDYGNKFIENLTLKEIIVRSSLSVIDASINEKIILRQDLYICQSKMQEEMIQH